MMICNLIESCKVSVNHSKKTLIDKEGGKSKYLIHNKSTSNYSIIDFENCVYKGRQNDTKCDFGLKTETSIFYIELKGSDAIGGIKQLLATVNETEKCFSNIDKKARLIVTRFSKPKVAKQTKQTKEYKDLIKKIGSVENFVIKQNAYTEII
ncbi:hypothetical protein JL193_08600 [Polaribacter batillariae]|uniref:Uncharacterized protein n=1 Tax=Polaribacter batillariae TaxID=2808900 RepID=A0ABX7SSD1_9FLAO|nr:hypothetical protein [Polaribacter batillariae]QTD36228.1 hypothetical protein JL193_08600 [Polaribacter batillariae]